MHSYCILADMLSRLLYSATVFSKHSKLPIMNLSRVDPAMVSTGDQGKRHFHAIGSGKPLLFTSVVKVDQSYLIHGRTSTNGKLQKLIKGSMLAGEFERFVGAVGMVAHVEEFKAQYYKDVLDFACFMDLDNGAPVSVSEYDVFFKKNSVCIQRLLLISLLKRRRAHDPLVVSQAPSLFAPILQLVVPLLVKSVCRLKI